MYYEWDLEVKLNFDYVFCQMVSWWNINAQHTTKSFSKDGFDLIQCDVGMDHEIALMASAAASATSSSAAAKAMNFFNAIACPIVS